MDKHVISGYGWQRLIAFTMLGLMGLLAWTCPAKSQAWVKFTLKTPEPRNYWVEPSTDMLGPAIREPARQLEVRHSKSSSRVSLIDHRLILHLSKGNSVSAFLKPWGLELLESMHFPGVHLIATDSPHEALTVAQAWSNRPEVLACYPVERKPFKPKAGFSPRPNDPFFADQWYLEQRNPITSLIQGGDINIRAAWPISRGEGVHIAVVDTGVDQDHPDLTLALDGDFNRNFISGTKNGNPVSQSFFHGTAVSGLIAASSENNQGVAGVAPLVSLSSWVIFGFGGNIADSFQLSEMYETANEKIAIQNHSWGNAFPEQSGPSFLERLSLSNAFHKGRSGKGIIMIRAGGNDRTQGDLHPGLGDVNDDGYSSMHNVIAVAATRRDGRATSYSNWGSCILVAAPGGEVQDGLFTTDVSGDGGFNTDSDSVGDGNYISNDAGFIGTSAAAPLVSGLTGLILSVNPEFTVRDVQQIVLASARHVFLDDPDITLNAAGFRHSHHVGFGIPDAGEALRLAQMWKLRDALKIISLESKLSKDIPDHGLRLKVQGDTVPEDLKDVPASTTMGPQPDAPTGFLPMSFQGRGIDPITDDLTGKGAIIRRGTTTFDEKITNASNAGASFVVVYNHQNEDELIRMAGTDYTPLPAYFIAREHGEPLSVLVETDPTVRMQLEMNSADYEFDVSEAMVCEHVEVVVHADHPFRGQLRIVLESPSGTRSVLQRLNFDDSQGPIHWAYRTTRHFFEPTVGVWKVSVTDQDENQVGGIRSLNLNILGTEITDTDADGLDDDWEMDQFGNLASTANEDPDADGSQNAREQLLGTLPLISDFALKMSLDYLDDEHIRLSWQTRPGHRYDVLSVNPSTGNFDLLGTVLSQAYQSEWIVELDASKQNFFQVVELAD
ncbi:MAG: S8 family serine peptidase [Verrucomicrobia bacterium]|nr:S8 family serine peptidase [Verrucomicrobiota bacterium]